LHNLDRNTLPFTLIGLYVHFLNRWPLLRAHTQDSTSDFPQVIPRLQTHLHTSHQHSCTTCGIWFLLFLSNRVSDPLLYFTRSHPISYSIPPSKCTSELQKSSPTRCPQHLCHPLIPLTHMPIRTHTALGHHHGPISLLPCTFLAFNVSACIARRPNFIRR
jgi:hypothetical protein